MQSREEFIIENNIQLNVLTYEYTPDNLHADNRNMQHPD